MVKDSNSNITGDRGYGKIYSKLGKKTGEKSRKMKVGNLTEKSEKSVKVQASKYSEIKYQRRAKDI